MAYNPYGPRGAESEREDFWSDIPEGNDMVPEILPTMPNEMENGAVPYCPDCPNADDPAVGNELEGDDGFPEESELN